MKVGGKVLSRPLGVLCLMASLIPARADVPDFQWVRTAGESLIAAEVGFCVTADALGNSYVGGYFNSTNFQIGGFLLTNSRPSFREAFVAKYDPAGTVLWAKSFHGTNDDSGRSIANDNQGNCYVAGSFASPHLFLDDVTLTNHGPAGNNALFVAKLDSLGNLLWARTADRGNYQAGAGIAVDANGNCYVTGTIKGTNTFNGTNLISHVTYTDVLLLKYDTDGHLLWVQQAGGSYVDSATGVAVDGSGNACLLANIRSTNAAFGSFVLSVGGTNTDQDMVIAKYDPAGSVLWAKRYGGTDIDTGRGIALDGDGNCYFAGEYISSNFVFGGTALVKTSPFFGDLYLAKIDINGDPLWVREVHGSDIDSISGVAVDFLGNSYIAGFFRSPTLMFDGLTITNTDEALPGTADVFAAKFDPEGNRLWVVQPKGPVEQEALAIALDADANAYITGFTMGTNVLFGSIAVTNSYIDLFVAKLESDYPRLQIELAGSQPILSWPSNKTGFTLESTSDFNNWMPFTGSVGVLNNRYWATNDLPDNFRFFRLRK